MRGEGAGRAAPEAAFELSPRDGGGVGRGHRQGGLHCVGGTARVRQELEVLIGKSERGSVWQGQGLGLDGSLNSGRALGLYPKGRGELLRSCSRDCWKEDPGGQGTPEPVRSVQGCCDCLGNPCPCPACANNPRNPRDPEVAHV